MTPEEWQIAQAPVPRPGPVVQPGDEPRRRQPTARSPKVYDAPPSGFIEVPTQSAPMARPQPQGPNAPQQAPRIYDAPPPGFVEVPADQPPEQQNAVLSGINSAAKWVGDTATAAKDYIVGKQDPKFAGATTVEKLGIIPLTDLNWIKTYAVDDAAYADILRKQLGNAYAGETKDANGFTVFAVRTADGKVAQAYVNKPGVDWEDTDRAISSTVPYLVGGGLAARAAPVLGVGGSLIGRASLQGLTAMGVSGAQDVAAQSAGSKQGFNEGRALIAALGGVGGELVGAAIAKWLTRNRGNSALVTPDGKLTGPGRKLVQDEGFDPNLVDKDLALELSRLAGNATDPKEALIAAQTGRFGIPTTKGQRTKDAQFLLTEKDLRYGNLGPGPKERIQQFDREQSQAIERAVRGADNQAGAPNVADAPEVGIAPVLNPTAGRYRQNYQDLGEGVRGGFAAAKTAAKEFEDEAWKNVGKMTPRAGATDSLPDMLLSGLKGQVPDANLQPSATAMLSKLRGFRDGKLPGSANAEFLEATVPRDVDTIRRQLLADFSNASVANGDRRMAGRIYGAYLDWVQDAAEKRLLTGDAAGAQALRDAMGATREARGIISGKTSLGQSTAVSKVMKKLGDAQTGEEALAALLGNAGPTAGVPAGAVASINQYRMALNRFGGEVGKQAWNDLRLSYWLRITTDKQGSVLSPGYLERSIRTALANQRSLMDSMFSRTEQLQIRRLADALKAANYKDPNPSGSGVAVRGLFPQLVEQGLETQAKRELFSKHNVLMSRLYRALAKTVRAGEKPAGNAAASRSLNADITQRPAPSFGGYGAAAGANYGNMQDREVRIRRGSYR